MSRRANTVKTTLIARQRKLRALFTTPKRDHLNDDKSPLMGRWTHHMQPDNEDVEKLARRGRQRHRPISLRVSDKIELVAGIIRRKSKMWRSEAVLVALSLRICIYSNKNKKSREHCNFRATSSLDATIAPSNGAKGGTVGMVGDLQGIAGKAMPEIPSLDMPLL